jgi:hypothetical protein
MQMRQAMRMIPHESGVQDSMKDEYRLVPDQICL